MIKRSVRKAFTLIEILIVVVILGILAAIVIPQFTRASEDAQIGNVRTQLQTIRSQIELYRVRHNGTYPSMANSFEDLVNVAGGLAAPDGNQYLKSAPLNPRNNSAAVALGANPGTPAVAGGPGWYLDTTTGTFSAAGFDEANGVWYAAAAGGGGGGN